MGGGRLMKRLLHLRNFGASLCSSSSSSHLFLLNQKTPPPNVYSRCLLLSYFSPKRQFISRGSHDHPPFLAFRFFNTDSHHHQENVGEEFISTISDDTSEEVETDGWEEEEEEGVEPKAGDGGGIVLQGVPWGERALEIASEVLLRFSDDIQLYAFKTTPRGYVYVRLDKLSNEYGCPSMEELESYCQEYKKRLEEVGALGEIPDDLGVEVSSPGAERILKVPNDLCRFKDMPMRVCYAEGVESNGLEKDGIFILDSIEKESDNCVWKLADVKENRDLESKGRPLSRKRRDWRLKLPFEMHRRVTLYLEL